MLSQYFIRIFVVMILFALPKVFTAQTKMVFFSEDKALFYLYVNGQLQNKVAMNRVAVENLTLRDYKILVEYRDIEQDPVEFTTSVKPDRENIFIIHEGNRNNKIELYSVSKKGEYSPTTKHSAYRMDGYVGKIGCPWPVGSKELNRMANELRNQTMQQARFSIVKTSALNKCLTVEQFGMLLEQFDDEAHKVRLAKFCIPYLYDRDNYEDLRGVFQNQRNMAKVRDYIESRRIK